MPSILTAIIHVRWWFEINSIKIGKHRMSILRTKCNRYFPSNLTAYDVLWKNYDDLNFKWFTPYLICIIHNRLIENHDYSSLPFANHAVVITLSKRGKQANTKFTRSIDPNGVRAFKAYFAQKLHLPWATIYRNGSRLKRPVSQVLLRRPERRIWRSRNRDNWVIAVAIVTVLFSFLSEIPRMLKLSRGRSTSAWLLFRCASRGKFSNYTSFVSRQTLLSYLSQTRSLPTYV